jgi:YD repeat-containing protein
MIYDGLKRKIAMNDLDCGQMSYVYDGASNLKLTTDAKGQQIAYTYDGVNRLLTEDFLDDNSPEFSYHQSPDVTYHYDTPAGPVDNGDGTAVTARNTKGVLAYVQDNSGEEHTSYDARGRVEWTIKRIPDPVLSVDLNPATSILVSYKTAFDYDSLDRVTRMVYPDNDEVTYQYNARSLLQAVAGGPSGFILSGLNYLPSGQQQEIDYGNGVRTTYAYDRRQRLVNLLTISQPSTLNQQLINFSYTFDGVSNIKAIQDQRDLGTVPATDPRRNSQVFAYDDLYRLTQVQYNLPNSPTNNGGEIDYRYDRIGNMLAQTSSMNQFENGLPVANLGTLAYGGSLGTSNRMGRQTGDPPGPHALSQISNPSSATTNRVYSYDGNGNMTDIDGLHCTWDFANRLVLGENNDMQVEYRYDYTGRRIIKRVHSKTNAPPAVPAAEFGRLTGRGSLAVPAMASPPPTRPSPAGSH